MRPSISAIIAGVALDSVGFASRCTFAAMLFVSRVIVSGAVNNSRSDSSNAPVVRFSEMVSELPQMLSPRE